MTTNNELNVVLQGATGTGSFVGSTSPTFVTPVLGAATATSLVFSPTTGGIVGTTTNDNAGSGKVGEVISSSVASGSAVSISNTVPITITSIVLTAGDWDIWGNINFNIGGAVQAIITSVSAVNNTNGVDTVASSLRSFQYPFTSAGSQRLNAGMVRVTTTGQTYYLVAQVNFTTSTVAGWGTIVARRRR